MIRGELIEFKSRPDRAIVLVLEDIAGGCTLNKAELKHGASGYLNEGILISMVSGMGHLVKTCSLWNKCESNATGLYVNKNHEFKVGDNISNTRLTLISRQILSINADSASYDHFYIGSGFGASGQSGTVLIEVNASGVSGTNSSFKYVPTAIGLSENPVDMARLNAGFSLMVRGTCRESQMPFPIDENLKVYFPLIRFV
jgi:hypothetical protein